LIISGELTNKNEASSSEIKIFAASSIAVASGIVLVALIGFVFFLARKKRQY
jgi:LPXTG-motif cell wall-anchored protein